MSIARDTATTLGQTEVSQVNGIDMAEYHFQSVCFPCIWNKFKYPINPSNAEIFQLYKPWRLKDFFNLTSL